MSRRERDAGRVIRSALDGERTRAEAARLLKTNARQMRRVRRTREASGG